jgi:AraC-like DNA-binding protein
MKKAVKVGEIASLMQSYADVKELNSLEGVKSTSVPGVHFYRASEGNGRVPLLYQSGIIVMGQGYKQIHLGEERVSYGPGDYLVIGVPLPLECEAFSENGLPILGMSIDVDSQVLHRLVNLISSEGNTASSNLSPCLNLGIRSESMCDALDEAIKRLLRALHNDLDAKVLGSSIVEEIVFRILNSPNGHILFDLAKHDGHYARIAKVLNRMHKEYAEPITVDYLAEQANMSVSGFHRAFRQVTTESPLQYLKKVRLTKAKELIQVDGKRASDAALMVGYSSTSQFSREFKRHFNATPKSLGSL